jgi:hypothetical protein
MRYQADLPVPFHEPLMRFPAHNTLKRCYKMELWSIFNTTFPQNPLDPLAVGESCARAMLFVAKRARMKRDDVRASFDQR